MSVRGYSYVAVLLLAAGLQGCNPTLPPSGPVAIRPECPTHEISLPYTRDGKTLIATNIGQSPNIATIPEFNDCQRLIRGDAYGPLVAIFASEKLDSPGYLQEVGPSFGRLVATVYSYDGDFPALHIVPEFNCLYFFRGPSTVDPYLARMAPNVGPECPEQASSNVGPPLRVMATPGQYDVPAVARWDWNRHEQSIGIKCLITWCEIGPADWTPLPARPAPPGVPAEVANVYQVKGYYDQQLLAPPSGRDWDHKTTPGPNDWTKPSDILGTIVPEPGVGQFVATKFNQGNWTLVATTYLEGGPAGHYRDKYGFANTPTPGHGNKVSLCDPTLTACPGLPPGINDTEGCTGARATIASENAAGGHASLWYAKVQPADGGNDVSLCVIRRDHLGFTGHMPSTARWRWLLDDDSIWIPCVFACCQVKGH